MLNVTIQKHKLIYRVYKYTTNRSSEEEKYCQLNTTKHMSIALSIRLESLPKTDAAVLPDWPTPVDQTAILMGLKTKRRTEPRLLREERRSAAPLVLTAYVESVKLLTVQLLAAMMRLIRSGMTTEGEMKLSLYSRC